MQKKLYLLIALILYLLSCETERENANLIFEKLTCDYQENPIVIEGLEPQFSWVINAGGFNKSQSAYRILVASSSDILESDDGDIWDSKKVESDQSTFIKFKGTPLNENQTYYWKVKIWDEKGHSSPWSKTQYFATGLEPTTWEKAKWISSPGDTRTSEHSFRNYKTGKMDSPVQVTSYPTGYFKNTFNISSKVKNAKAFVAGLGLYELYLNGEKVGDRVLEPAPTNYDKTALYSVLDVTEYLQQGQNAIGIILGNGFYGQNIAFLGEQESQKKMDYGMPSVKLYLDITMEDGAKKIVTTNENWEAFNGPIVFDNIYSGEVYDARFEIENWNTVEYNTENASKVSVMAEPTVGKLIPQTMPPIRKIKTFEPSNIFQADNGNWIVDFGQNIAGWVKIEVQEKAGQRIDLQLVEALTRDGKAIHLGTTGGSASGVSQQLTYICKGDGIETWEPRFTYHGFQYAEISGLSKAPDKNNISAVLVATDVSETGSFESSDSLLNQMDKISRMTVITNLHGIPEDCPQREKCGWLGDAHAWAEFGLYNYDLYNFYKKYMDDIRTQFRSVKGRDVETEFNVPTMIAPGKRTSTIAKLDWGIATIYLPWYHYLYSGDTNLVMEYYEDLKQLTEYYLTFKNGEGIIENGMGDWCPPRWDRRSNPTAMECDPIISASAYFYDILKVMKGFAHITKDKEYETFLEKEIINLKEAFNQNYLVPIINTDAKWYGSQTATVMALQFDIVPQAEKVAVLNGLIYNINEINNGHHTTGIHGNRYLYTVLSKFGKPDLAYNVLTNPEFPSQAFVSNYGFTTWPERQWDWESGIELNNSLNHPMQSGFAAYFYEMLGGIKPVSKKPGFKEFAVNPIFPKNINHTVVSLMSPYGKISSKWKISGRDFEMKLTVPFNSKAILPLSASQQKTLQINDQNWATNQLGEIKKDSLVLGSGNYKITYQI